MNKEEYDRAPWIFFLSAEEVLVQEHVALLGCQYPHLLSHRLDTLILYSLGIF